MKKNMGYADRVIRLLVALVVGALYFMHVITGTFGIVLIIASGIFLVTSFMGFCPLYFPFGIRTDKKQTIKL